MTTFRSGYGDFTYGNLLYGIDAALVLGDPAVSIACTATASGQLIKDAAVSDTSTLSPTVAAYTSLAGQVSDTITSSVDLYWNRVMSFDAATSMSSDSTEVSARYKWLDAEDPTTTWTTSDYLERAA